MVTKRAKLTPRDKELLAKDERARLIVAKARANKRLMDGLKEVLESRARGEKPVRFEDLDRKDA